MMKFFITFFWLPLSLILPALAWPGPVCAGPPASIKVVMDNNYPPYVFQGPGGILQGILVDQWRLWERRTGIKVEISALVWDQALRGMKAGQFDVIDTIFATEERSRWLDFGKAYAKIEVPAFFANDISGITDSASLRDFVVAVKSGDSAIEWLRRNGVNKLAFFDSYQALVLAAKERRISVFVADKPPALYYLYQYGIQDHFNHTSPLYLGEFHRAVRKGNQELLRTLDVGFARIPPVELDAIDAKWYGATLPAGGFLKYPLYGAGLLALLALALCAYSQALRRAVNARTSELKASKDLFETIYHSVNDAIFIHDPGTGAIVDVNQRMLQMFGCTREEALSLQMADFSAGTPPYTRAEADAWMVRASRGTAQLFPWKAKSRDGRFFWIELNMRLARIGEVDRILVAARDISERKAAEESLNLSRELFQAAFQSGPLLMAISDVGTGRFLEVNDNFLRLSGYTREEVIGKTSIELGWIRAEDRKPLVAELVRSGRVSGTRLKLTGKNGVPIWCLYFGEIISIAGEQRLLSLADDLTERNLAEEQLRQAVKMEAVGHLAGGVAHDYNNMLTVIIGSAELLKNFSGNDPMLMKLSSTILDAAKRSADLTRELLTFSRKGERTTVMFDIHKVVRAVVSLLEHSVDKNILLDTRLFAGDVWVSGDPSLLQSALLNLGINARDALPGGGTLTIATENLELDYEFCLLHAFQVEPGPYLEIAVSDTGAGIAKDDLQHIFEPFFTTKAVGEGTGLGLAMVYGTVKSHRGMIEVSSEPGKGTTFKLYLPLAEAAPPATGEKSPVPRGEGSILLVDDEPLLRDLGKKLLEDLGYRVYLAENGEKALEVYAGHRDEIALVLLDMIMPKMGGKETLQRLVERYPEVVVLITSGFHREGNRNLLKNLGAKGFLQKPYRRETLARAVAQALAGG
jgi:two-component system, cell cycle sensor histidine kinase and response regulator CckA